MIVSRNEIGPATSGIKSQLLASIPDSPTNAPTSVDSLTSCQLLNINWSAVSQNGGSEIISYSLEIDDG